MIVRDATSADILHVVKHMRAADAAEQFAVRFEPDSEGARLSLALEVCQARRMAIACKALCVPPFGRRTDADASAGDPRADVAAAPVDGTTVDASAEAVVILTAALVAPRVAALHRIATDRFAEIASAEFRFLKRRFIPFALAPNVGFATASVPADDAATLRWLGRLGFTPHGAPLPYGIEGRRFAQMLWLNPGSIAT